VEPSFRNIDNLFHKFKLVIAPGQRLAAAIG